MVGCFDKFLLIISGFKVLDVQIIVFSKTIENMFGNKTNSYMIAYLKIIFFF